MEVCNQAKNYVTWNIMCSQTERGVLNSLHPLLVQINWHSNSLTITSYMIIPRHLSCFCYIITQYGSILLLFPMMCIYATQTNSYSTALPHFPTTQHIGLHQSIQLWLHNVAYTRLLLLISFGSVPASPSHSSKAPCVARRLSFPVVKERRFVTPLGFSYRGTSSVLNDLRKKWRAGVADACRCDELMIMLAWY